MTLKDLTQHNADFESLVDSYQHEIQLHCYRMMGSLQDAEDLTQETLLKVWRALEDYEGKSTLRTWLYRIATNTCLDALRKRKRRSLPTLVESTETAIEEVRSQPIWIEPYPDGLLPALKTDPEMTVSQRESISLAFIVALQTLPGTQRAVLILRDVLGWQASEAAEVLDTTVSSVNSALFRARSTLAKNPKVVPSQVDDQTQDLLYKYLDAWISADVDRLVEMLVEDATFSMPPLSMWFRGRADIAAFMYSDVFASTWHMHPTSANGQPAFIGYRLDPADKQYKPVGVQVVTVRDGMITDIITFLTPDLVDKFDLPTDAS